MRLIGSQVLRYIAQVRAALGIGIDPLKVEDDNDYWTGQAYAAALD
jgi:hypothetical protein